MLYLKIVNDATGNEFIGNYNYQVGVNHDIFEDGRIEGFKREDGYKKLLTLVVRDINKKRAVSNQWLDCAKYLKYKSVKDMLYDLYYVKEYPVTKIAKDLGFGVCTVFRKMEKEGIKRRNSSYRTKYAIKNIGLPLNQVSELQEGILFLLNNGHKLIQEDESIIVSKKDGNRFVKEVKGSTLRSLVKRDIFKIEKIDDYYIYTLNNRGKEMIKRLIKRKEGKIIA